MLTTERGLQCQKRQNQGVTGQKKCRERRTLRLDVACEPPVHLISAPSPLGSGSAVDDDLAAPLFRFVVNHFRWEAGSQNVNPRRLLEALDDVW